MEALSAINFLLAALFAACYCYQAVFLGARLLRKRQTFTARKLCRYAVLIAARNESAVIAQLLESIRQQDYPQDLLDIYGVADNCTDGTASIAREHGARVFERQNKMQVGKGYALDFLLDQIKEQYGAEWFDGYFVFDADNLLQRDYVTRMNEVFDQGCAIVTSYRNSKNYGDNWISAGYALWFLRDAAVLNAPRAQLGISCVVAGTGFLFSGEIMRRCGGWPFHTLTEDTEFTVHNILQGEKIGYCGAAEIFDEQPTRLSQSWRQRLRWAKGYLQVLRKDGGRLAAGIFSKNGPSCFDMLMSILPAMVLTFCSVLFGSAATVLQLILGKNILPILVAFAASFAVPYLLLLLVGIITTATQWHSIRATAFKKVLYTFAFPLFMLTYIPISIAAIFSPKVEWKPIEHKVTVSISEMK